MPHAAGRAVGGLAVGALGALGVALGPVFGAADADADTTGPLTSAAVLAAVCVLLVPLLAALALRRHPAAAGALLAGLGAVSVGAALLDVQLFVDAIDANRLELFRPISAGAVGAGPGAYAVFLGHVLLAIAGALGLMVISHEAGRDGYGSAGSAEFDGRSVGGRIGALPATLLVVAAGVFALSLLAPAFSSQDPVVLVRPLVGSAGVSAVGTALIAAAVLVVIALALTSTAPEVGWGAVVGAGLAALAVGGTRVVAGTAAGNRIDVAAGSVVAASAATVIVLVGAAIPHLARWREARIVQPAPTARTGPKTTKGALTAAMIAQSRAAQARVSRLHRRAGVVAVVTAVTAAAGALLPVLSLPDAVAEPTMFSPRLVLCASGALVIVALGLFSPRRADAIRPVVGVVWTAIVMSVAAVMQSAVIATDVPGVGLGVGALVLCAGAVLAVATGIAVWVAGSAEREDVDTSAARGYSRAVIGFGGLGAVAVLIGTALPLYRSESASAASVLAWPWGIDTWGQLFLGVGVVAAATVAVASRRARATALLAGSALAALVYLGAWPLTSARAAGATLGAGAIATTAGIVLLVVAAFSGGSGPDRVSASSVRVRAGETDA